MGRVKRQTGRFLMIGHNQRKLAKADAEARKLIEANWIGDIITFKTNFALTAVPKVPGALTRTECLVFR